MGKNPGTDTEGAVAEDVESVWVPARQGEDPMGLKEGDDWLTRGLEPLATRAGCRDEAGAGLGKGQRQVGGGPGGT